MERCQRIEYEILGLALRARSPRGYPGNANYFVAWLRRIFPNIAHREFTDACGRLVTRGALELRQGTREPGTDHYHRGGRDAWFFYRRWIKFRETSRSRSMKRCQNIPQVANMFRVYADRVVLFKKPFQSLVADCPYHPVP